MKNKLITIALSALMALSLAGCGNNNGKSEVLSNEYVTIKQYKGLEVTKTEKNEVTDDIIESTIENALAAAQTREEVTDRAAELGDTVNIDYTGSFDGEEFEGGSAEGYDLELGSGSFIGATEEYEGFEEQIVGHQTGEEFDINVQFPDPYTNNTDYSGKVAVFHIKLNTIYKINTPELTDEWVKENSEESTTVEEYREETRKMLEKSSEETWQNTMRNAVMEALMEQIEEKEIPQDRIDEQYQSLEDNYKQMAEAYGMEFSDFITSMMGMDEETFQERAQQVAKDTVKRSIACELIAEKLELEPTEEEYQEKKEQYAEEYGYDVDTFVEEYGEDVIREAIRQEKVADFLVENCVEVEETDESAEDGTGTE